VLIVLNNTTIKKFLTFNLAHEIMAMKIVALSCLAGGAAGFVVGAGPHALRPSGLPPALSTRALPARTRSRVCTVRMIGGENSKISKQPGLETGGERDVLCVDCCVMNARAGSTRSRGAQLWSSELAARPL
jgi:hypothetical protein